MIPPTGDQLDHNSHADPVALLKALIARVGRLEEENRQLKAEIEVEAPAAFAPVPNRERIASIDTLRGVAVLGILLINIIVFGLPESALSFLTNAGGHTGLNLAFWYVNQIFFEGKMRALFSMLYGINCFTWSFPYGCSC